MKDNKQEVLWKSLLGLSGITIDVWRIGVFVLI